MKTSVLMSAVLLCASLVPVQAQQAKQNFTLINATGYAIKEVYVSPNKTDSWEEDILGDDILEVDGETRIRFTRAGDTCRWDLKVVYKLDNSNAVWSDIDLCTIESITIKWNAQTNVTSATFR